MSRKFHQIETELLVLQSQAGDMQAMRKLVIRWSPVMTRHAIRLLGRSDGASDLVQESWLAIVKGLKRLDDPACFPRWSLRIVTNKVADWIRRAQRERDHAKRLNQLNHVGSESDLFADDDIDRLSAALQAMPPDRRTLLAMYYLDERSVGDIAAALNIPRGTVKSRLHHARNELRTILERGSQ